MADVDVATTDSVETLATSLSGHGLRPMDALHMASAIAAGADFFLTTDKQILRKMSNDSRMHVLDPVEFIRETEMPDE